MFPFIRAAYPPDISTVAARMRVRDIEEVKAACGMTPLAGLSASFHGSTLRWVAEDEEGPFVMFGCAPTFPDVGSPWLLATDRLITKHLKFFLKSSPPYIQKMTDQFPFLVNYVDARHTDSLAYLQHAGFTLARYLPEYGVERRPFFRFTKTAEGLQPSVYQY